MDDFEDFDSPLDLDGDGDDAMEMCLFFDDEKQSGQGRKTPQGSGCCLALLMFGSAASTMAWGITKILS